MSIIKRIFTAIVFFTSPRKNHSGQPLKWKENDLMRASLIMIIITAVSICLLFLRQPRCHQKQITQTRQKNREYITPTQKNACSVRKHRHTKHWSLVRRHRTWRSVQNNKSRLSHIYIRNKKRWSWKWHQRRLRQRQYSKRRRYTGK